MEKIFYYTKFNKYFSPFIPEFSSSITYTLIAVLAIKCKCARRFYKLI